MSDFLIEDDTTGAERRRRSQGGNGYDRVRYDERTGALNISIDGRANDGEGGIFEGDNVRTDNEQLFAGRGSDNLSGSAGPDDIIGGWGERIDIHRRHGRQRHAGRAGRERHAAAAASGTTSCTATSPRAGGRRRTTATTTSTAAQVTTAASARAARTRSAAAADDDSFDAGPGPDILKGGAGADTLHGGDGNDDIEGAAGVDNLFGDNEDDYIRAKDGLSDTVNGGAGTDTAELDLGCNIFHCFDVDVVAEVENKTYPVNRTGDRVTLDLRLELDRDSIGGEVSANGGPARAFSGYAGLIAALESIRTERAPAAEESAAEARS